MLIIHFAKVFLVYKKSYAHDLLYIELLNIVVLFLNTSYGAEMFAETFFKFLMSQLYI